MEAETLEKVISQFLSGYFWKFCGFIIVMFIINWLKDFISKFITRNNLMSNQIINEDKIIKIDEYVGRVSKISLTHVRLESEEGIYHVPISSLMTSKIVSIRKERIYDERLSEPSQPEDKKEEPKKEKEGNKNG